MVATPCQIYPGVRRAGGWSVGDYTIQYWNKADFWMSEILLFGDKIAVDNNNKIPLMGISALKKYISIGVSNRTELLRTL